ncbi:MAG: class I SAM-dependent methyltransferase [Candidatus Geothermarchaeales archaeon]
MRDKKRIVEEGYDRIAEAYRKARAKTSHRDEKYLKLLLELLPRGSKVLDLGCGAGVPTTKLLARHHEVTGIDISAKQIEQARKLVPEATFHKADMTEASFPPETLDAVCSLFAIIHVPREEHPALFKRLHRMLRPDGLLLVNLGSTDWVSTPEDRLLGVEMHWSHYDAETNKKLLENAGFNTIQSSIEGEKFHGAYEEHLYVLAKKT